MPRHHHIPQKYHHWHDTLKSIMEPVDKKQTTPNIDVGGRLRELRSERGLSVRTLAEMSGLNFNTLSLIENEKTSPSVSTLQRLAQALQIPITAFFETTSVQRDIVHQKPGQRPKATFSHGTLEDMGAGLTLGDGTPLLIELEPGAGSGPESIVHTGQEFVYCLEGHLTYTIAGEEYALASGDSLIFQAHLPHRWENKDNVLSRSILILCPSDENDLSAEQHFMTDQVEGKSK